MAGLYKRGKTWWARAQRDNREYRRSLKTADKAIAEKRLRQWLEELDSASLGSNPSPPATLSQAKSRVIGSGQDGQIRTERAQVPHVSRHSGVVMLERLPPTPQKFLLIQARLERLLDRDPSTWGARNHYRLLYPMVMGIMRGNVRIRPLAIPGALLQSALRRTDREGSPVNKSRQHVFLENVAVAWIRAEFGTEPARETYGHGGRVDVECRQSKVVIECGNTGAMIPLSMLLQEPEWRFFQIPFQWSVSRWTAGRKVRSRVFMFEFSGAVLDEDYREISKI